MLLDQSRTPESSTQARPWRVILVLVFTLVLVVQGFLSFAIRPEPYPIIRMPSFGMATSTDGTYPVTFISAEVEFADGASESISPYAIMAPFRFSTARPSYDYMFGPSRAGELTDDVVLWLADRVVQVSGRPDAQEIRMCWKKADVNVRDASISNAESCDWTVIEL
jgi:hypothetical protein